MPYGQQEAMSVSLLTLMTGCCPYDRANARAPAGSACGPALRRFRRAGIRRRNVIKGKGTHSYENFSIKLRKLLSEISAD